MLLFEYHSISLTIKVALVNSKLIATKEYITCSGRNMGIENKTTEITLAELQDYINRFKSV